MRKIIKLCIKYYCIILKRDGCQSCENTGISKKNLSVKNTPEAMHIAINRLKNQHNIIIWTSPTAEYSYIHYQVVCSICKGKGYGGKTYWRERDEYFK